MRPAQNLELGAARTHGQRLAPWLDLVANQAAWWWCVLLTRAGSPAALLGPLAYFAGRLLAGRGEARRLLRLAAIGALTGLVGDAALVHVGVLAFPTVASGVAPFMLALWAMFAVSLTASAGFLTEVSVVWCALAGAVAGPLAYAAGERLGVLSLRQGAAAAIALEWMIAVPWLARHARRGLREAVE